MKHHFCIVIVVLLSLGLLTIDALCSGSDSATSGPLLLEGVRVFDTTSGTLSDACNILIVDDVIKAVGDAKPELEGLRRIDCSGKYAVPGLFDCHTHLAMLTIMGEGKLEENLCSFVASGITHVRDVGGPVKVLKGLSDSISSGEQEGPEFFYTGPMLERSPLTWGDRNETLPDFTVAIDTCEDADRVLAELAAGGACLVKTFSKFDLDVYKHLVAVARKLGLRIVHDPGPPLFHEIPMDKAIELGVKSIEHGKAPWPVVLKDELKKEHDQLLAENSGRMQRSMFMRKVVEQGTDALSMEKLEQLAGMMRDKGVYFCPTLQVFADMGDELPEDVPESAHEMVRKMMKGLSGMSLLFTKELIKQKVEILVGQDGVSADGTFAEMALLEECGLAASEIIRGATLYPARFLGVQDRLGSVTPGKEADILVVDHNPLEKIDNLQATYLVVQQGRVVFRKDG